MDENKKYEIKISGINSTYTYLQEIDAVQKAKIVSFIELSEGNLLNFDNNASAVGSSVPQANNSQIPTSSQLPPSLITLTPPEYLIERNPSTIAQKIATFAVYLKEVKHQERFNKDDIVNLFEETNEAWPVKHHSRDFKAAVKKGYIFKDSNGEYFITNNGMSVVNSGFANGVKRSKSKRGKITKKSTLVIRDEVENLVIEPNRKGYQYYWKINKGEKVLWLLTIAKESGIVDLNFKEISRLADKVNDVIESKQITSLISPHVKAQRVYPLVIGKATVLRITPAGEELIKDTNNESNKAGSHS